MNLTPKEAAAKYRKSTFTQSEDQMLQTLRDSLILLESDNREGVGPQEQGFLQETARRLRELIARLEQNPADDEEAITREWVYENMTITCYGAKINNFLYLKQSKAGWGIYAFDANSDYVEEQFLVASVTTRRDLRALLRGLGK